MAEMCGQAKRDRLDKVSTYLEAGGISEYLVLYLVDMEKGEIPSEENSLEKNIDKVNEAIAQIDRMKKCLERVTSITKESSVVKEGEEEIVLNYFLRRREINPMRESLLKIKNKQELTPAEIKVLSHFHNYQLLYYTDKLDDIDF